MDFNPNIRYSIACKSKSEYLRMLRFLENKGFYWGSGVKMTKHPEYYVDSGIYLETFNDSEVYQTTNEQSRQGKRVSSEMFSIHPNEF